MALSYATKQALWLRYFLTELGLDLKSTTTTLYVDNRGAIDLSKEPRHHSRSKHIPIHYHFIRELVANNTFTVLHCRTQNMVADGLTKPLRNPLFDSFISSLGLSIV